MISFFKGVAALLIIVGILGGTPWLLLQLGQMPGFLPASIDLRALLRPDDGRLVLLLIWGLAWLMWAWMAILILVELTAALRGLQAPRLPAASLPQGWARALVVTALALFMATPLAANATPADAAVRDASVGGFEPAATAPLHELGTEQVLIGTQPVQVGTVEVKKGDTLWDLADEHLGNPLRWPEIYQANKGVAQVGGATLTHPDHIDVGWVLQLPAAAPTPLEAPEPELAGAAVDMVSPGEASPVPTPEAADLPVEPASVTTPHVTPASQRAAVPRPLPGAAQADSSKTSAASIEEIDDEDVESAGAVVPVWQVTGLVGAGLILGGGVAASLYRRRREQFRTRRPGRTIPTPPVVVGPVEKTAQYASGLVARQIGRLDQVLRRLQSPEGIADIHAVAVSPDGSITLRTSAALDGPWRRTDDGWLLDNHVPLDSVGTSAPDQPCPYPLLVTIGADAARRLWLVNLEHLGVIHVAGDPVMRDDFMRYIAAELAVNPWSEGTRIACEGVAAGVIAVAPERLDASLSEVTGIARINSDRGSRFGTDAMTGRAHQLGDEAWAAAAVLADASEARLDQLATLITDRPGSTGTAIVTAANPGHLTITPDGRVRGLGFDLTSVGLTEDEAAGCAALLSVADLVDDEEPPAEDEFVDVTGNLLPRHRVDRADEDSAEAVLPRPDDDYLHAAEVTVDDLADLAPRVPHDVALELQQRDPSLDQQVAQWFSDGCPVPRLALLGPVTAKCLGVPIAKQRGYYTEVLTYLALHPNGVTTEELAEAFSITPQRARTVISNCRRWVGDNLATKQPFIPDARSNAKARERGTGIYLVDDLLVDVDLFRRLRTRGLSRGAAGIEDLDMALRLVRGRPFEQLRPAGWQWLSDGDRIDQHMICAIGDVAHTLVTHHRQQGDLEAARKAASIGIMADPDSETAKLDLAGVLSEADQALSARRILADILGDAADLDLTARGASILKRKGFLEAG